MRKPAALFVAALAVAVSAHSATPASSAARFPNSEDLRHLRAFSAAQLSPDGRSVLFSVADTTADGGRSHLWLVSADASQPARQLTFTPEKEKSGESAAEWSPDGKAIFFLAHRGDQTQLFRLSLQGGEAMGYVVKALPAVDDAKLPDAIPPARKVAAAAAAPLALSVSGYEISPDGRWLALWARDPETPGEKAAHEAKADATWTDHQTHRTRLYLAHLAADGSLSATANANSSVSGAGAANSGKTDSGVTLTAVTFPAFDGNVTGAAWSPQSDRLVAIVQPPNGRNDLGPAGTAWLVPVSGGLPVRLTHAPPTMRGPMAWSADATSLYFAAQTPEDAPPGVEELYAMAAQADAQPTRLMAGFDGSLGYGKPVALTDGRIVVAVERGFGSGAVTVPAAGGSPQTIAFAMPAISGLATNRAQTGWVWLASASDTPTRLCFSAMLGGDCHALPTPPLSDHTLLAVRSVPVHWANDGFHLDGVLSVPPAASDHAPVPLIVEVHGGPLGAWSDRYDPWVGFLLGHGWAVFRANPRGSSGYGWQFAAANKNDLGGGDLLDILTGLDAVLKSHPELDSNRLALMGYSYGGEMAGFVEGKTTRFRAIVSGAPVIDQFSEYGTEGGSWYDRWYYGLPWEHFTDAWRQSPISRVAAGRTPFLLLQGEADTTDPMGQSQEMYRALRQMNIPVEMMLFPRENHGPLARGIFGYPSPEPWHGWQGRQRVVQFLNTYLGAHPPTSGDAIAAEKDR